MSKRLQIAALLLIVALGLALRIGGLDRVGFNEDEVHKVEAARAYLRGNFLVNLEHPMLMKSLIAVSVAAADTWNGRVGHSHQVSEEVAVRLPNVIFGSLTAVVIFLLAQEFFGVEVGLLSALLWSIGTIAIMVNREAKEDTLLVFFTWLAYYFYLRAKKVATRETRRAEWYYAASGGCFGLMLASKYFPHYLGLIFLFFVLLRDKVKSPPRRWRDSVLLFGTCALVFILADPVVLLPSTLKYMLHYVGEGTMTHHGYLVMGHLYFDDPAHLRGGMPIYFYPLFLILKTPVSVLVALLVGLTEVWKRRRERGPFFLIFMFLFWIVPFSLLSAKWLRYMLSWMPTVYIIAALGVFKIFTWASAQVRQTHRRWVPAVAAAVALIFLVEPASMSAQHAPYYSLYLNPLGLGRTAYYFPHDEMNDMGLREAIQQICLHAPKGASVGGETAPVFAYYFHRFGRDDFRYFDLSDQAQRMEAPPTAYIVVQDGRKYYENISFIQKVESYQMPIQTVEIGGAAAVRVYRDEQFAELRIGR
jgi:4-amino-4-deoxy-L-arabinose transferase-like glycosyltransferase